MNNKNHNEKLLALKRILIQPKKLMYFLLNFTSLIFFFQSNYCFSISLLDITVLAIIRSNDWKPRLFMVRKCKPRKRKKRRNTKKDRQKMKRLNADPISPSEMRLHRMGCSAKNNNKSTKNQKMNNRARFSWEYSETKLGANDNKEKQRFERQ